MYPNIKNILKINEVSCLLCIVHVAAFKIVPVNKAVVLQVLIFNYQDNKKINRDKLLMNKLPSKYLSKKKEKKKDYFSGLFHYLKVKFCFISL